MDVFSQWQPNICFTHISTIFDFNTSSSNQKHDMGSFWSHENAVGRNEDDQQTVKRNQHSQHVLIKIENKNVTCSDSSDSRHSSCSSLKQVVPFYIYGKIDMRTGQTSPQTLQFRSDGLDDDDDGQDCVAAEAAGDNKTVENIFTATGDLTFDLM